MIKNTRKIPDLLYKYSCFDNSLDDAVHEERLKAILHENKIWFSDPSKLNDSFEFRPKFETAKTENEKKEFRNWINETYKRNGMNREERRKETRQKFKELQRNPAPLRDLYRNILGSYSIYCLTEDPKSILMWAYYADGHKGYCLEFSPSRNRHFSDHLFNVNYSAKYPIIKPWTVKNEEIDKQSICTKSIEWEHECEWRLFGRNPDYNDFSPEVLTGIIIGYKMEPKYLKLIEKLCSIRSDPLRVFYTKSDDNEYVIHLVNGKATG